MKVSVLMAEPVIAIDENSSAQEAAETMGKEHIGSLLVTRRGTNVGIVTERDIMSNVIAVKGNLEEVKVKAIMSTPLVTIDKDADAEDAIKTMVKRKVRRLLVTDKGKIVGIFTTSDVTKLAL